MLEKDPIRARLLAVSVEVASRAADARVSAHLRETPTGRIPARYCPAAANPLGSPPSRLGSAPSMGGMPRRVPSKSTSTEVPGRVAEREEGGVRTRGRWHAPRRLLRFASAADRDKYPADSRRMLSTCTPESGQGLPHRQFVVPPASRNFRILEVHPPRPLGPGSCMGAFAPGPRAAFDARRPGA